MPPLRAVAPPPSKRSTISVFAPLSCAAIAALAPAAPTPTTRTSQRQSQCSADSSSTTRALSIGKEIGRASFRERESQSDEISVCDAPLKKKTNKQTQKR